MECKFIYLQKNFLFVVISIENRKFPPKKFYSSEKLKNFIFKFEKKIPKIFLQNYVFLHEWNTNLN